MRRRNFLAGAGALIAVPSLVRASSLEMGVPRLPKLILIGRNLSIFEPFDIPAGGALIRDCTIILDSTNIAFLGTPESGNTLIENCVFRVQTDEWVEMTPKSQHFTATRQGVDFSFERA